MITHLTGPSLSIFSGDFCHGDSVVREILSKRGFKPVAETELIAAAVELSGLSEHMIRRTLLSRTSIFDKFTREKECSLAYLRLFMARALAEHNLLFSGALGHLVPREVTHLLKVCIIGDLKFRTAVAVKEHGLARKEATRLIGKVDAEKAQWVNTVRGIDDPWDSSLYDMVIPMVKTTAREAASLVEDYLDKDALKPTSGSKQAVADFLLAAESLVSLAEEGHDVDVSARNGAVTVTINKKVLMLNRLTDEIQSLVGTLAGVKSVEIRVGNGVPKAEVYRKYDFKAPSKILLVDDEREFVQTLSERLILRDMGSAVAHDGKSALEILVDDEPDVLVLDLKMPGIDGIEVLRRVKKIRPEVEVIILTGHGSGEDRKTCMQIGAFAYLHKPVDIDVLTSKIKEANEAVRQRRINDGEEECQQRKG